MLRMSEVMPELRVVVQRFPVAVACCVLAFLSRFFVANGFGDIFDQSETTALTAAFLASGAAHLYAETRGWKPVAAGLLALGLAAAAGALAFAPEAFKTHRLFLFIGLVMALFVAPFLRANAKQGAVWLFGLRLGLAAVLAFIVGLTLMLGLFAILYGLKFLFGLDFGKQADDYIISLCVYLVGPLFGLAMVPHDVDEEINLADQKGSLLERGVSILVNYIKVPLAFVYALLLHVYALKIIVLESLPQGEVGWVVTVFSIAGTLAWLLAWPFRESGTQLLKLYSRFWFWFLPVPVVLLGLAVWQRIGEYGVTEDRYGLVLVALWAALVCGYLVYRRMFADMRVVIGGAAALLLLGSFGPIGALTVTTIDQSARFEKFLNDNAMLENGKLKTILPKLSNERKRQGYSILQVLAQNYAMPKALAFLTDKDKELVEKFDLTYVNSELEKRFGFENYWLDAETVNFYTTPNPISVPFAGEGRVLGPFQFQSYQLTQNQPQDRLQFSKSDGRLKMIWSAAPLSFVIDERTVLKQFETARATGGESVPIVIAADEKMNVVIYEGVGQLSDDKAEITSLSFWVIARN